MKFQQSITVLIIGIFINIQAIDSITTNQLKSIFTEIQKEKAILSILYEKVSNRPTIGNLPINEQISYLQFMSRNNRISKQNVVDISYQISIILELEKDYIVFFKETRPPTEQKLLMNYIIKINKSIESLKQSIEDLFFDQINIKKMTLNIIK